MKEKKKKTDHLLALIREGRPMTSGEQFRLTVALSVPAIVTQLSAIVMQYIDAAMVGSLGANASASIGLVSTTTWLFWGLCAAASTGFSVQVAHRIGADDWDCARSILRRSVPSTFAFSALLAAIGVSVSGALPQWLGGDSVIRSDASLYFLIFSLFLPIRIPSIAGVLLCILDVGFNFFLIFPSRELSAGGLTLSIPGAGLGVQGAALGTGLAESVAAAITLWYLFTRSSGLKIKAWRKSPSLPAPPIIRNSIRISLPMGLEHVVICGAQIMTTVIVAPLGIPAIAANSFAITAESLCYMPGYGIADAATTLVGQSLGAGRHRLTRRFAYITVFMGMAVMGIMGVVMYIFAPQIIGTMTPVEEIRRLGVMALRIEAFAEPMFAAAIISYGVFVGAANTLVPSLMNFFSIWAVRISLAAWLAPTMGLKGVWVAMCAELCFRGIIFLIRLRGKRWMKI